MFDRRALTVIVHWSMIDSNVVISYFERVLAGSALHHLKVKVFHVQKDHCSRRTLNTINF